VILTDNEVPYPRYYRVNWLSGGVLVPKPGAFPVLVWYRSGRARTYSKVFKTEAALQVAGHTAKTWTGEQE
jgi:hypothetical protein